ncbi:long-chain-fatty-acid--CoA ligase 5 [Galendromus occidentalis]|uniref:Long-chain-fatty-acid--CoA ligase n=1 Tax=Galendromus occidentalis TaxID=34638 RepID=A0AAJ6QSX4_9ACAR|nr:long-chain-fatty-acid--CoA ligase 5 [Galendromus occidentalis]
MAETPPNQTVAKNDMGPYAAYGAIAATGVAGLALQYMFSNKKPVLPVVNMDNQSREIVSVGERVRMSRLLPPNKKLDHLYDDARTLHDVMFRGARVSKNGPCLGYREPGSSEFTWIHYNQVLDRNRNFACGLQAIGITPGNSTHIGIFATNSPECIIAEMGCYYFSMVLVPLYDSMGLQSVSYIVEQANIETAICDTVDRANVLLDLKKDCPALRRIIMMRPIVEELQIKAAEVQVELFQFSQVESIGEKNLKHPVPPNKEQLATICYTSGTTGNPKGVMLTHKNIIANLSAVMFQMGEWAPNGNDVMLSFLPLAHMFERCCEMAVYMVGGAVGFYSGDIRGLMEDMQALKPTIAPMVPRLLNRIHDSIITAAQGSKIASFILNQALRSKQSEVENFLIRNNHPIWDRFVFNKVQQKFGGRIRLFVVGSAPLASNVLNVVRCALGCIIVEGYGQTECTAPCTLTFPGDILASHVGPPLACCEIKVVDVPEMNYYACNGEGEVCVKGSSVFAGYFKDPQRTHEALDAQGWLHTGDIGKWLENGTLKITDRLKHIFKLAQGEYIAPEKIENILIRSPFVMQIFIHGDSLKSCLVAVVVPDPDYLLKWASQNRIGGTYEELCANKVVKKSILDDLLVTGKKNDLKSFELMKDLYLESEPFSVENELLTPTLKTKRAYARARYAAQIEEMYHNLD